MGKLLRNVFLAIFLIASVTLVLWQSAFSFSFRPEDPGQNYFFFAISLLIFLLMVTLGFMLVRIIVKAWVDGRSDRYRSRIRAKLVLGALALSSLPVLFMVLFNVQVMNRTLARWFYTPTEHVMDDYKRILTALGEQTRGKALAEAQLIASMPEAAAQIEDASNGTAWLDSFCRMHGIAIGAVFVEEAVPLNFANQVKDIENYVHGFQRTYSQLHEVRTNLLLVQALIALFVFFVAGWLAQIMARQISIPISALLHAAEEVRKGNLTYRVETRAIDELAQLVIGFNRMTADLEANRSELDSRRRFTEAILESIPTGIISLSAGGAVQRVNKALDEML